MRVMFFPADKMVSFWLLGKTWCFNLFALFGPWLSLGVHVQFWPPEIDIHFLWFVLGVMTRRKAEFILDSEQSYLCAVT